MTRDATDTTVRPDVVDLLINQHMTIRDLFTEVEAATGDARTEAFHRLVTLLAVHETAEEQVVHPLTRLYVDGGNEIVDDRLDEEREAKETLVALEEMGRTRPSSPDCSHSSAPPCWNMRPRRKPTNSGTCGVTCRRSSFARSPRWSRQLRPWHRPGRTPGWSPPPPTPSSDRHYPYSTEPRTWSGNSCPDRKANKARRLCSGGGHGLGRAQLGLLLGG